jgi:hypothetical protein
VREFFLYGAGVPRYVALWLPLFPLLVGGLVVARTRRHVVAAVALSTVPTFFLHNPPYWLGLPLRWGLLVATLGFLVAWLVARVRAPVPRAGAAAADDNAHGERVRWPVVVALVGVALALRVPLAWADPGISDFATATETAARQLLAGDNPWTLPNPFATVGTYQYPIATPLWSLPFVAAVPELVLGEAHVGARAAVWAADAAAIAFLAWAAARWGRRHAGELAAFAYAVHPTLVRESGIVVANDLLLALAAAAAAVAVARPQAPAAGGARERRLLAAALVGVAISIKPAAAVLLPLVLVGVGVRAAAVAAAVPVALQVPFLLYPRPGLWGLAAIAEPLTRPEPAVILELSSWWPAYALFGGSPALLEVLGTIAVVTGFAVAAWAGWQLRRRGADVQRASAAVALALLVPFVLATVQRTNYQDWYLTSFLLCAALAGTARPAPRVPNAAADDASLAAATR